MADTKITGLTPDEMKDLKRCIAARKTALEKNKSMNIRTMSDEMGDVIDKEIERLKQLEKKL